MAKITIKDIAAASGVSISTVSRVINGNPSVDPAIAERVLAAARQLGYRTSPQVLPPSGKSVSRIALILPTFSNSYFPSIAEGVIDTARANGQMVSVMIFNGDYDQELECLEQLSLAPTDGIIIAPGDERVPLEQFPALKNIPLVIAARRKVLPGVPHIYADNISAGYIATKYLLRLQRRNIALFLNFWGDEIRDYKTFLEKYNSPARGACTAFDRYTGYIKALEEEGIPFNPDFLVFSGFTHEAGYAAAQELLASPTRFDALLITNDRCATGALRLLNEQGIEVPGQVSIICFNGGLLASTVTPALTMIEQDNYRLGAEAATRLNELMHNRPAEDRMIDVRLVIKGSTAMAADN